jgi:hypothetical protein
MRKAVGYLAIILFCSLLAGAQAAPGFTKIGNITAVTYVDSSCPDQISCYYQVTAVDATGHESVGAACSSGSSCLNGNQVIAAMPNSGTHTVTLNWTASTSTGVSYNVYQHVGPFPASGLSSTVN